MNRKHHLRHGTIARGLLALLLGAAVAAGGLAPPAVRAEVCADCLHPSIWQIQPAGQATGNFWGVAAVASNDVWAVGRDRSIFYNHVEHWNGSAWTVVAAPQPGDSELRGVAASAATDVWAVGQTSNSMELLHWNGTAWSLAPQGYYYSGNSMLSGVTAQAGNDAWAVGFAQPIELGEPMRTLIMHWNGSTWLRSPSPNRGSGDNRLYSVSATAPNDAWATGEWIDSNGIQRGLVLHWDGSAWGLVTTGLPGHIQFYAVAALAPDDVWAAGASYNTTTHLSYPYTAHWDGTSWSHVATPGLGFWGGALWGLSARNSHDLWGVGAQGPSYSGGYGADLLGSQTLIMHWNGSQWTVWGSPNGASTNTLYGVAVSGTLDAFAVGHMLVQDGDELDALPLIERLITY